MIRAPLTLDIESQLIESLNADLKPTPCGVTSYHSPAGTAGSTHRETVFLTVFPQFLPHLGYLPSA
jgi:hypothetical protein